MDLCSFKKRLENFLYPPVCSFCDSLITEGASSRQSFVCKACESNLPFRINDEFYPGHTRFPLVVSFYYEGPLRLALRQLKFHGRSDFAAALAPYLAATYKRQRLACDFILPVPLHYKRLRQRGYNQAALLAEALAEILDLPLVDDLLLREGESERQSECRGRDAKLANVQGIFSLNDAKVDILRNSRVLLLDDIVTSGATMAEAGSTLEKADIYPLGMAVAAGNFSARIYTDQDERII